MCEFLWVFENFVTKTNVEAAYIDAASTQAPQKMIWFLILLPMVVFCQNDGQVTKVEDVTDMSLYPLTVGSQGSAKYYKIGQMTVTPQGFLSTSIAGYLQSWKTYQMPDDDEFHYMSTASYHSIGLTNGPSSDPYQGCLRIGIIRQGFVGFFWVITDLKVWVYIVSNRNNALQLHWLIPVADLQPGQTVVYEIAVSKKNACVSFSLDRQERYRYCGQQGIDPKFLSYAFPSVPLDTREPKLTSADFGGNFIDLIYLGRNLASAPSSFPACLDATFHICADTNYRAWHTKCTYISTPPQAPGEYYEAQLDQIQMFHVKRTDRCRGYSDSSSCHIGNLGRCTRYYDLMKLN